MKKTSATIFLLILLCKSIVLGHILATDSSGIQSISFAAGTGRLDYDLDHGSYSVYFNGVLTIANAYSQCYSDSVFTSTSTRYTSRKLSSSALSDSFGTGTRYTVTLTGIGRLQMRQIFYVYNTRGYFYTEVALDGAGSNCYRMIPLISNDATLPSSGDTRALFVPFDNDMWVRYNAAPLSSANFTSSEVTALYDNTGRSGLVIGSVEHGDWKTGIKVTGSGDKTLSKLSVIGGWVDENVTRDKRGHGWVSVGKTTCKSPKIFVGSFSDWRSGLEEYGKSVAIADRRYVSSWTNATPFGWNSWGVIQTNLNLTKAMAVVDFFADSCAQFRNDDSTLYIDLDSYWDKLSDADLKTFCNYCTSKGLRPGIYWGPFVDWGKNASSVIQGSTYTYGSAWLKVNGAPVDIDNARAMDPTHPGTQDRIRFFAGRFKKAGFQMIKIDFLGHASLEADGYYDDTIHTGMQAYHKGMKYLIDQLGPMLMYAAISPNLATGPYVHMRRIACDAFKSISETGYTLNSTTYGWWLDNVYNYLDADHIVFGTETVGANRARLTSAIVTGTLITGDDFSSKGTWTARAQSLLQNKDVLAAARTGKAFRPVEGNTGNEAAELFVKTLDSYVYLAAVNYGSSTKSYSVPLPRIGLSSQTTYNAVKELYTGSTTSVTETMAFSVGPANAALYRFAINPTANFEFSTRDAQAHCSEKQTSIRFLTDNIISLRSPQPLRSVKIFDCRGRLAQVWSGAAAAIDMSTVDLKSGAYFLILKIGAGDVQRVKFVKTARIESSRTITKEK